MQNKSPFYIVNEFISPLQCEDIVGRLNNTFPQTDINDEIIKTEKTNQLTEMRIMPIFDKYIPSLEEYFGFEYFGTTKFITTWYPAGFSDTSVVCDNSINTPKGWKRINEYDFSCFIFLNDSQDEIPFDDYYEVKGGKHEYVTHGFGFNPTRGTLIIHPSCPNFAYSISPVLAGNLNVMRFNVKASDEYIYDMNKFGGNYKTWF